jgi:hypothetical protein
MGHANFNGHGVSPSGVEYTVHDVSGSQQMFAFDSANNFTLTQTVHFIRQGETTVPDDFMLRVRTHATQNTNGELTATFDTFEDECR